MKYTSICELARRFSVPPQRFSDLFYRQILDNERCPLIGHRRVIPEDYVPEIEAILVQRGILQPKEAAAK